MSDEPIHSSRNSLIQQVITIVYQDTHLLAYAYVDGKIKRLVQAEMAGSDPLRNTTHIFLNTIVNRYKDVYPKVAYPIGVNVIFSTQFYLTTQARKDLISYLIDRKEIVKVRTQKTLMEAAIDGWQRQYNITYPWIALEGDNKVVMGVKQASDTPLLIRLITSLNQAKNPQSDLSPEDKAMIDELVKEFNSLAEEEKGFENEGFQDSDENKNEIGDGNAWNELSNRIFLHITNLYSKLPECKSVFLMGRHFEQSQLGRELESLLEKNSFQAVLIPSSDQALWAALSMQPGIGSVSLDKKTQKSNLADAILIDSHIRSEDSTSQSQTLTQITDAEASDNSNTVKSDRLLSSEFVVEERIKDQSFMLFNGFKKNNGPRRLIRHIPYTDYERLDQKTAFIKVYKKERKLYPKVSTVVNGISGKYYYLPDIKAKSLRSIIAQSRLKKGSEKEFKSEDIQLILDIYKTLDQLPITFTRMSADNIFVRRREWWRRNSINEVYFLGITPEDSTKEDMLKKLDDVLQSLLHPRIIEHIDHFKNDI